MHRFITSLLALSGLLVAAAVPAQAQYHHHSGGSGNSAVLAGIAGVAVGALGATVIAHSERASTARQYGYPGQTQSYPQSYPQSYAQPTYQQSYAQQGYPQQQGYAQPSYQQGYPQTSYQQSYAPPVAYVGRPVPRPAPNGVRCLVWNGQAYVPMGC